MQGKQVQHGQGCCFSHHADCGRVRQHRGGISRIAPACKSNAPPPCRLRTARIRPSATRIGACHSSSFRPLFSDAAYRFGIHALHRDRKSGCQGAPARWPRVVSSEFVIRKCDGCNRPGPSAVCGRDRGVRRMGTLACQLAGSTATGKGAAAHLCATAPLVGGIHPGEGPHNLCIPALLHRPYDVGLRGELQSSF